MKLSLVAAATAALSLSSLVCASDRTAHVRHLDALKRAPQNPATSSTTSSSSRPTGTSTTSTSSSNSGTGTSTASTTSTSTGVAASTPLGTAVTIPPLSAISSGNWPAPTLPLTTTFPAGASPPIAGAPPLPTFVFSVADWPKMDIVPPTDSEEVQEWMKELEGFDIPDLEKTINGSCLLNPTFAADASNRGWWTCGGFTRPTDITVCPDKFTWGMSFDDGPTPYTPQLLKYLTEQQLKATFFVVGSRVVSYPDILRDEYMSGHEISVHTWSHHTLTNLTNEEIVAELGWARKAIQDVLGITPTTMRPPFGDIDDRVRAISLAMGLVPIIWTRGPMNNQFDTNDWQVPGGEVSAQQAVQSFTDILGNSTLIETGFIVLEHDLFPQEVELGVGYFLPAAQSFQPKLTLKPIGACQGWPETNMYLETTTNTTFPYPDSPAASQATTTANARATGVSSASGKGNDSSNAVASVSRGVGAMGLVVGAVAVVACAELL